MRFFGNLMVCALTTGFGLAAGAAECPVGFEAMQRLELLPVFLPNGTQTKQFIAYDPAGDNRANLFKRYEENGEYVFFDEIGPGFLCRQQMNVFSQYSMLPNEQVRIRYYFDDEAKPRIDMTLAEFFGKGGKYKAPFTPPLAFFDVEGGSWAGPSTFANLYYPFPFNKRLKIAIYDPAGTKQYGSSSWFQYTYLKYPPGTPVETWKGMGVDSPAVQAQFQHQGEDPKKLVAGQTHKNVLSLAPRETKTALDLSGQGAITSLRLRMEPWSHDTFFHTRIRITWDDQTTAAVDMPIGCFFGAGGDIIGVDDTSGKTLATLFYGFDAKTRQCYSYWPMPYWSRAQIEIVNGTKTAISRVEVEAVSAPPEALRYRAGESGYFCAKRTTDISPDKALYSRAFQARGRGKLVGMAMYSKNYNADGDEYTFIDGSRTPQIHGNGTEDDHNQGYDGYAIQKPYWGGLLNGFQGAYRLYIVEPYVFDSSIDICYEHSRCGAATDHGQKTDFVAWYYQDVPGTCNLKLTDKLDVGNATEQSKASEKAHQYKVTGEKWAGMTASSYDRMEYEARTPTTNDDGRAFAGASEFTVKIDPANEGVKIRRRVNRNRSNVQRTDVYVDGQLIAGSPWYVCDLPVTPETAFRDTDYEIPTAYTKGKERLTIKLQHVVGQPDNSSNEYHYWVYCYGRTPVQP